MGGQALAGVDFRGTQLRSSDAGAEDAQHGVLSTVKITRMPAAAAAPTRRSVKASAAASTSFGRTGSSVDHRSSARTTLACSLRAAAIWRSATAGLTPLYRPITLTPPSGPVAGRCELVAPCARHGAAAHTASASATVMPARQEAGMRRRPAMVTPYSPAVRRAQGASQ